MGSERTIAVGGVVKGYRLLSFGYGLLVMEFWVRGYGIDWIEWIDLIDLIDGIEGFRGYEMGMRWV